MFKVLIDFYLKLMKNQLIKHIEAYVAAKASGNDILIEYAIQILTATIDEVLKNDDHTIKE